MRAVTITEDRSLIVAERSSTRLSPGQIRVRVEFCGICGSDLHIRSAESIAAGSPVGVVLGHEFVGIVEELAADVAQWKVGDRVAGWPNGCCGECELCREGQVQMCPAKLTDGIGMGRNDGALAESVVMRADRAFAVPAGLRPDHAALAEPLAVALRAVGRGELKPDERPVIIGAGPVGLMVAVALRAQGLADPLLVEVNDRRAAMARTLGFDACAPAELVEHADRLFGGQPTVIFECAGHVSALPLALQAIRPAGGSSSSGCCSSLWRCRNCW